MVSNNRNYLVNINDHICECLGFKNSGYCKHLLACNPTLCEDDEVDGFIPWESQICHASSSQDHINNTPINKSQKTIDNRNHIMQLVSVVR